MRMTYPDVGSYYFRFSFSDTNETNSSVRTFCTCKHIFVPYSVIFFLPVLARSCHNQNVCVWLDVNEILLSIGGCLVYKTSDRVNLLVRYEAGQRSKTS